MRFHKRDNSFRYEEGDYLCAMKVLMVCHGNICRSPLAEGILKHKLLAAGLDWEVDSAGTSNYHEGEAPHVLSQKVAAGHGIDISGQVCRRFVKEDILRFDKIYAMDSEVYNDIRRLSGDVWNASKTDLLMNEVEPGRNIDVPDPWYGAEDGYHVVFDMISLACDSIIEKSTNPSFANKEGEQHAKKRSGFDFTNLKRFLAGDVGGYA
jgi:protein-tyrosine phosphatase